MPQDPVTVHVKLTLRDLLRLAFRTALARRTLLLHGLLLALMLAAMVANLTGAIPGPGAGFWATLFLAYAVLFLLILPLYTFLATQREWARSRATLEDIAYTFGPEGVDVQSATNRGHMGWDLFDRALETREDLLVFLTERQALVIPKRAFRDEAEVERVRAHLREGLGERARVGA